jgi:hypothetical protein
MTLVHTYSLHVYKWVLVKTNFLLKFQQQSCTFYSLFILACGHYRHRHTSHLTSCTALTAACQSVKSHYSVTGMCEISFFIGGQKHAWWSMQTGFFSIPCLAVLLAHWGEVWTSFTGYRTVFRKSTFFLLSLYVIITTWDCHCWIYADWTKQATCFCQNPTRYLPFTVEMSAAIT